MLNIRDGRGNQVSERKLVIFSPAITPKNHLRLNSLIINRINGCVLSCAQQVGVDKEILLIYNNLANKVYYIFGISP